MRPLALLGLSTLALSTLALSALGLATLTACSPTPVAFTCINDEPLCSIADVLENDRPLAAGLSVDKVAYNQAAEILVMEAGAAVEPSMPLVEGRDALFRVWFSAEEGSSARSVIARLYLYQDGALVDARESAELSVLPGAGSTDGDVSSTFLIEVPGVSIVEGLSYSVELLEVDEDAKFSGSTDASTFPAPNAGAQDLDTDSSGPSLVVYMVPVQYDADSSGRTPPTDLESLQPYIDGMYAYYPAAEVEFIVGDVLPWSQRIQASGAGFDTLLSAVGNLRGSRPEIPAHAYIYGYFQASASFGEFCSGGCVTGLSNLSNSGSVGIGYGDNGSVETMVHEVGHAHGRSHSPGCGAAGADPGYPYGDSEAIIGTRGYNLVSGAWYDPESVYDMMSYCSPYWISDYTFRGLFTALKGTNGSRTERAVTQPFNVVWAMSDGSLQWGPDQLHARVDDGELVEVELLDGEGRSLGFIDADFSPFDHLPGGLLRFPAELAEGAERVRFEGRVSGVR